MATPKTIERLIAFNRFGLGWSPASAREPQSRDTVLAQLADATKSLIAADGLPPSDEAIDYFADRRNAAAAGRRDRQAMLTGMSMQQQAGLTPLKQPPVDPRFDRLLARELDLRVNRAITGDAPLLERLVLHWFNHFTVSAAKGFTGHLTGAYEREAIRPNVLGRFGAMLEAAVLHPAMLFYLDNVNSTGPKSKLGRRKGGRGLNENLAREVLELHALGVNGGYTQDDVVALAKILSGWTVALGDEPRNGRPRVGFNPDAHEPGSKQLLGKTYSENGGDEARQALQDLARHPSTAKFICRKLVAHVLEPNADAALGDRLTEVYAASDGDLAAVTRALVLDDRSWTIPPSTLRSPIEFVLSTTRLLGRAPQAPPMLRSLEAMGQPFWKCPAPAGWPDGKDVWSAPDSIKTRLDWSMEIARSEPSGTDARALAESSFGDGLSDDTRKALTRAASKPQALTLLLMSPEFQRR